MSRRENRLGRLLAIRRLNEELDRNALAVVLASLAQAESAIALQETSLDEARQASVAALEANDRSEWLLADAQREVAGWNRERLNVLVNARADDAAHAMQRFLASRLEHDQVKQLVEDARGLDAIEEGRRAQSALDDWFLNKRTRGPR